jgi:hypothetical protein
LDHSLDSVIRGRGQAPAAASHACSGHAAQGEGTGSGRQRHQQIDVAVAAAVATTHRSEDPNTRDAAPASQGQQLSAVRFDQRMHQEQFGEPGPALTRVSLAIRLAPGSAGVVDRLLLGTTLDDS